MTGQAYKEAPRPRQGTETAAAGRDRSGAENGQFKHSASGKDWRRAGKTKSRCHREPLGDSQVG